ncbi:hypothetical protein [Aeromicrobium sp. CF3.5]|uniref:hypothetical protein n=1 Tax=Aeromicrobium sp. CF3.5 TaxID=3373078 RepID=UPI003EE7E04C
MSAAILLAPSDQRHRDGDDRARRLALAGWLSARIGASSVRVAVTRIVIGGTAGLGLTYAIGRAFGTVVG